MCLAKPLDTFASLLLCREALIETSVRSRKGLRFDIETGYNDPNDKADEATHRLHLDEELDCGTQHPQAVEMAMGKREET